MSAAFVAALPGCATITKGTDQVVTLDTPGHPGSTCILSAAGEGSYTVQTPANVDLRKSRKDISVSCSNGCFRGTGVITSRMEGMTAGNLLLGGVVGLGVDAASGAMNKYSSYNQVAMAADPACAPQQ